MDVPRRMLVFDILAVIAACVFVRLGFWQLHRLDERRVRNALVSSRMRGTAVDAATLAADTAAAHYRRATVTGTPDYDHELLLIERTHGGAPGVEMVTPVRVPGRDSAVLVLRGWAYAGDGATIDRGKFRESSQAFSGYVEELVAGTSSSTLPDTSRSLRQMQAVAIEHDLPYPVLPFYIVALGDSVRSTAGAPIARIGEPVLDEGPHMSYAIQWFSFALIALAGAGYASNA